MHPVHIRDVPDREGCLKTPTPGLPSIYYVAWLGMLIYGNPFNTGHFPLHHSRNPGVKRCISQGRTGGYCVKLVMAHLAETRQNVHLVVKLLIAAYALQVRISHPFTPVKGYSVPYVILYIIYPFTGCTPL